MPKKTISVRVPPDTHERFEEYREKNSGDEEDGGELSKADAGRRLLERGLDLEGEHSALPPLGQQLVSTGDYLLKLLAVFVVGGAMWSLVDGVTGAAGLLILQLIITGLGTAGAVYSVALAVALFDAGHLGLSAWTDALGQLVAESELPRLLRGVGS